MNEQRSRASVPMCRTGLASRFGSRRGGFTLLEVVIVLSIGGILATVSITSFSGMQGRMAVRAAQSGFLSMHAQTRALAIERGTAMRLAVDQANHTVRIEEGCAGGGTVLQSRDFGEDHKVTLNTGGAAVALCMTPRGYAAPNLNSFSQQGRVGFVRGEHSSAVILLPLGQAVRE